MATTKLSDEEFLAFLEKHPDLRDRFASIVGIVENSEGSQGGGHGRRADHRGDAAFGAGGDAGVGGAAGRSDGTRNSSTTSDASPR